MKNSGEPKASTSGRTIGDGQREDQGAEDAPKRELISAAPSARPASPLLAMA